MTASLDGGALLSLLHLCDSAFPVGSFGHSDGLEAATSAGMVTTAADLRAWLDVCLIDSLTCCDGPAVAAAWSAVHAGDVDVFLALDSEVLAIRPSSASREASRSMGARLLKTWVRVRGSDPGTQRLKGLSDATRGSDPQFTLPVAFGAVCAAAGIARIAAVEGFMYTRLSATVSAAMRLMPLGQHDAHTLLADLLARVPDAAERAALVPPGALSSFLPAMDIAQMSQPYVDSRLFRS